MKKYESIIIVKADLDSNEIKKLETKIINLINKNGNLAKFENLGKKKLAYEIKNCNEGIFIDFYFKAETEFVSKLNIKFKTMEEIIIYVIIKIED